MRHKDAKLELLRAVPLFANLDDGELADVGRHADEVSVGEGKVLVTQDTSGNSFYVIIEGRADVMKDGQKLAELGDGDFLGEMALLEDLPRSATVVTTAPTRVLEMHRRDFSSVLDSAPHLARKMLATLAHRLRHADEQLVT
ncbi:MAG: cyclic nucleotide-binding domain-containing protein [Acidimicrobiia bacterium]|nr:cyclic nucleotide-binding domain-containing protein [Acidimicrobiia bacterium]MBT8216262.1 cyclic nucleotide-binding domain-containing protein [Acidimicrobiia bacterium]NNF10554.1 cyclic nucleotide-binding domain-containing protein [Acidimicrobiia bacterium]NNL69801.1 cyclic nucleotide-binding domain-containing protein [Acidimicrobiia bacterium]